MTSNSSELLMIPGPLPCPFRVSVTCSYPVGTLFRAVKGMSVGSQEELDLQIIPAITLRSSPTESIGYRSPPMAVFHNAPSD